MSFKKIEKEFCLTDDSVNCYGYRLLTEGLQLERFSPAIGFLMHDRSKGVAVRWEDLRLEGDKLYAKPVVNTSLFPGLAEQIEAGFYSAASVGHIVALEINDSPDMKLDGQTDVTVTKWFPRECSIVDIPGNYNALAKLYDEANNIVKDLSAPTLTEIQTEDNHKDMNELKFNAAMLAAINVPNKATALEVETALKDLAGKAAQYDQIKKELNDLKESHITAQVSDLIEKGKKEGKLTNELAAKLQKDYKDNPRGLKDLVDTLPKQTRITGGKNLTDIPEKYKGKTRRELFLSGELENVKKNYPALYEELTQPNK
jgi:hypothetical protein